MTLKELKKEMVIGKKVILISRLNQKINEEREIVQIKSNAWIFKTPKNDNSWLDFPKASLFSFDGEYLTIYSAGYRNMTEKEKEIRRSWKCQINQNRYYAEEKAYYQKNNALYLMGLKMDKGKRFDYQTGLVQDEKIKGEAILVYKLLN